MYWASGKVPEPFISLTVAKSSINNEISFPHKEWQNKIADPPTTGAHLMLDDRFTERHTVEIARFDSLPLCY